MSYGKYYNKQRTAQSEPIPGKDQIQNNAGGFVFRLDPWKQLDRFLVLGTLTPNYYVTERDLTVRNAELIEQLIASEGDRVVDRVVEISSSGRAIKNDPALFVLAMCAGADNQSVREYALSKLTSVARTGTHLFTFIQYVLGFRKWGRGLRNAVASWYNRPNIDLQVVKYRQRNGWTHRDLLRLAHVKPVDNEHAELYHWITQGYYQHPSEMTKLVEGFVKVQDETDADKIAALVREYNLPREALPTEALTHKAVWQALLERMPLIALVRNLGVMSSHGVLKPGQFDESLSRVLEMLTDENQIKRSKIHPMQILSALVTYSQGHGMRGNKAWDTMHQIVDALNTAFYLSFGNLESTGKRVMLALDVSPSMRGNIIADIPGMSARYASAAMALVTANAEPLNTIVAFAGADIRPFNISPRMRLETVMDKMDKLSWSDTDCALPMLYALENKLEVDTFIVYTDNETWSGRVHPVQALQMYRNQTGIDAKLIVVGMTATGFTIADPDDPGMLDVVGFDTAVPQVIQEFMKL